MNKRKPIIKIGRPPQTDDELDEIVQTLWGIKIPRKAVCKGHSAPFDAFAEAYFGRVPVSIWKGSRGLAGKSVTLATLCGTEAVCLGAQVTILGGSSAQSQRVHEVQQEAWASPLAPMSLLTGATMYTTRLRNGAWIRSLTASQRSARGPHPQRLRLDEIDEMDLSIAEAAQGQPMDAIRLGKLVETQTVMSSTHQYPDKTMTEMLKRARTQGWSIHEWCVSGDTQVVSGDGIMPITQLREGMQVLTRVGYRTIQHVTSMGRKPTVTVTTTDGRSIICTGDHRIATGNETWTEARDLKPGSEVTVANVVTTQQGTRQGSHAVAEEAWLHSDCPVASFSSSVVASVVPGDVVEVFDIGVEEAHEFVGNGIVVHNCYRESVGTDSDPGWLTQSMVERKRSEIPKHMWDTEYDLQEPSITGRAIDTDHVEKMFDRTLGEFKGEEGERIQIESFTYSGTYVTGVDWAKESDWTVITTYRTDVRPWKAVAWMRVGRKPWPAMIRDVESRLSEYGGTLIHDATGIGNVVNDFLTYNRKLTVPFLMVGRDREAMFNDYIAAIEACEIVYPMIDYAYGEHKYVTWSDLYGSGHPPDSVVSGGLPWMIRNSKSAPVTPGNVSRSAPSPWTGS